MPSITSVRSTSLDLAFRQIAAARLRSTDEVNAAVSQHLSIRDYDGSNSIIRIDTIELNLPGRLVRKKFRLVHLTLPEVNLLHYFMAHARFAMSHARILGAIWGVEFRSELEYLQTYLSQLRKKLADDSAELKYLLADHTGGHLFADLTETGIDGTYPGAAV